MTPYLYDGTDPNFCNGRALYERIQCAKGQLDTNAQAWMGECDASL